MGGRAERAAVDPPRLWTPEEADRRLPALGELLGHLRRWSERLPQVDAELERLRGFWGTELGSADHPDHELAGRLERERTNLTERLREALAALSEEGIEVKDLSSGLVDFYGVEDGELVLLCWRTGEPEVGFYHSLTAGFQGRRPLRSRAQSTDAPPS